MELSRLLGGGAPFVTNLPVYLATTANGLKRGAVVANGATGATRGFTLSVATTTAACKDWMGVLQISASFAYQNPDQGQGRSTKGSDFRVQSDLICDRGMDEGNDWLPTLINPDALFFAWYSTTQAAATASDTLTQSITASTGTVVDVTSVDDDLIGGWLFSHSENSTGTPTYSGSLRYVSATVASGSFGLTTAMNVSTDSSLVYMKPPGLTLSVVNSTGQHLRSGGAAGAGAVAQGIYNFDNYGEWARAPMHPLRLWMDDGSDDLTDVRLYGEIFLYDHYAFNIA